MTSTHLHTNKRTTGQDRVYSEMKLITTISSIPITISGFNKVIKIIVYT